jgi:hypothetical protein
MSKLVTGLMFSTLAFAASTFYLSYQLGVEREKNLRVATPSPPSRADSAPAAAGIAPEELNQLLAQLARQARQAQQRWFECQREPTCDTRALSSAPDMSPDNWIAVALGPERYALYREHQASADAPK